MKKTTSNITKFCLSLLLFTIFSCNSESIVSKEPSYVHEKTVIIENVDYEIENVDPSFWLDNNQHASTTINFWVNLKDTGIVADDIESVRFISSNNQISWEYINREEIKDSFNAEYNYFKGRCYCSSIAQNGSVLPIGEYEVIINLKNNQGATKKFLVSAPGSVGTDGYNYVYNEECPTINNNYIKNLSRANVLRAYRDVNLNTIKINFTVNDLKAYNGFIQFYDRAGNYAGKTRSKFRESGIINYYFNQGTNFYTNGQTNELIITLDSMHLSPGYTVADFESLHVFLTDGNQFNYNDLYSYISISAEKIIE